MNVYIYRSVHVVEPFDICGLFLVLWSYRFNEGNIFLSCMNSKKNRTSFNVTLRYIYIYSGKINNIIDALNHNAVWLVIPYLIGWRLPSIISLTDRVLVNNAASSGTLSKCFKWKICTFVSWNNITVFEKKCQYQFLYFVIDGCKYLFCQTVLV